MRIARFLHDNLEAALMAALTTLLALLMMTAAVCRHFSPDAGSWAVRAAGACLAWLVFLGIPCAAARTGHSRLRLLEALAPPRLMRILAVFSNYAFLLFAVLGLAAGTKFFLLSLDPASGLSLPPLVYLSAPVGFALTVFRLVERLFHFGEKR